jgi:hypothetical protein
MLTFAPFTTSATNMSFIVLRSSCLSLDTCLCFGLLMAFLFVGWHSSSYPFLRYGTPVATQESASFSGASFGVERSDAR